MAKGTIERISENTFRLTVYDGFDQEGKRIRHRRTIAVEGATNKTQRKDAYQQLATFEEEIRKGINVNGAKMTFSDFIKYWQKEYAEKQLAPKTQYWYGHMLETRIIPALGHIKLMNLKPVHLMQFYDTLSKENIQQSRSDNKDTKNVGKKFSSKTIHHYHEVISSVLTKAVKWQFIESNPARRVEVPKVKYTEAKHYNLEQAKNMLELLGDEPLKYQILINLALLCEMRRGEILGLEWSDIDFKNNTLKIKRTIQYVTGRGVITKEPKTQKSRRTISVPLSIINKLKKHRNDQRKAQIKWGSLWINSDRVFTAEDGAPMFPDTPSKWFAKFLKNNELPYITFHQLRHTGATLMISEGIDIRTVSARLGHSRTSTTLDIYSHALQAKDRQAADDMEALLLKSK